MATTLPAADPPTRRRQRHHASNYKFVRHLGWLRTERYQARLYLSSRVCVNLGTYDSEWSAGQAVRAAIKALPFGPLDPLRCWLAWRDSGLLGRDLRPELLPMGVVRHNGRYYARRVAGRGDGATGAGPFDAVEEAYAAWLAGKADRARPHGCGAFQPPAG